ncbi:MAG TPA: hypothetical protein VIN65_00670, partial [Candidatus Dormibacteraeota bacterium]
MAEQVPAAPPPPPPPALIPSGDGYSWRPDGGTPTPLQPQSIHRTPAGGQQQRRGGLAGGILAAIAGLFKYG